MNDYRVVNILDMMDAVGEEDLKGILSDFSCAKNLEIENFLHSNSIDFAKKKMSITHLVLDEDGRIAAIFTLAHKAVEIKVDTISATMKKKISRFAQFDTQTNSYTVSAFLIAQFGKNFAIENNTYSGERLMKATFKTLKNAQRDVGGGIVYLDCEDKQPLLDFYESEKIGFRKFGERYSDVDNTKYIQLLKFF